MQTQSTHIKLTQMQLAQLEIDTFRVAQFMTAGGAYEIYMDQNDDKTAIVISTWDGAGSQYIEVKFSDGDYIANEENAIKFIWERIKEELEGEGK